MAIGQALHSLRKRPHKQTHKTASTMHIQFTMIQLFNSFIRYVVRLGYSEPQLIEAYFGKANINDQRIDTGR